MHEVLVNRLGGLSLPRKSVVRSTDRPDMTLDVYRGRKTTTTTLANDMVKLIAIRQQWVKSVQSYNIKAEIVIWRCLNKYINELGHLTKMAAKPI